MDCQNLGGPMWRQELDMIIIVHPSNSECSTVLWFYNSILFPFASDGFNQGIFICTSVFHPTRGGCASEMVLSYLARKFQEFVQGASPSWHLQRYLRTLVHERNSGSQEFWGLFLPLALIAMGGINKSVTFWKIILASSIYQDFLYWEIEENATCGCVISH